MDKKQKGLALLSVLIVLTLAILLVAGLSERLGKQVRFSSALQNQEQIYWYSLSAEELAKQILLQDFTDNNQSVHLAQVWALESRSFPLEKGVINLSVEDHQSCFNLNSLAQPDDRNSSPPVKPQAVVVFQALLINLGIEEILAEQITEATRDWVHPSRQQQSVQGASDNDYLSLPVPYLPGNISMRDRSEWRAVLGVTPAIAHKALPYLCALPNTTLQFNINTLPTDQPALLAAITNNSLSVSQAEALLSSRPREGWQNVGDFIQELPAELTPSQELQSSLSVNSHYFEVNAHIQVQDNNELFQSLLVRETDQKLVTIRRRVGES